MCHMALSVPMANRSIRLADQVVAATSDTTVPPRSSQPLQLIAALRLPAHPQELAGEQDACQGCSGSRRGCSGPKRRRRRCHRRPPWPAAQRRPDPRNGQRLREQHRQRLGQKRRPRPRCAWPGRLWCLSHAFGNKAANPSVACRNLAAAARAKGLTVNAFCAVVLANHGVPSSWATTAPGSSASTSSAPTVRPTQALGHGKR